jgi:hypothetical protein
MGSADALYLREGDAFVGTGATKGSWYDNGQAGGAVLALLGHVLEDVPTLTPMTISRLTVDIVRPVPLGEPLYVDHEVLREGKRIQLVELSVRSADDVTTHARALRLRDEDIREPDGRPRSSSAINPSTRLPPPSAFNSVEDLPDVADFLIHGAELRQSPEPIDGQHALWIRLRVPVVAGEAVRPTSLAVLPFDMVNLLGVEPGDGHAHRIINPDVSGHVTRAPVGEWVAVTGNTYFAHAVGHGMSIGVLSDAAGVYGLTSTSQLVGTRAVETGT